MPTSTGKVGLTVQDAAGAAPCLWQPLARLLGMKQCLQQHRFAWQQMGLKAGAISVPTGKIGARSNARELSARSHLPVSKSRRALSWVVQNVNQATLRLCPVPSLMPIARRQPAARPEQPTMGRPGRAQRSLQPQWAGVRHQRGPRLVRGGQQPPGPRVQARQRGLREGQAARDASAASFPGDLAAAQTPMTSALPSVATCRRLAPDCWPGLPTNPRPAGQPAGPPPDHVHCCTAPGWARRFPNAPALIDSVVSCQQPNSWPDPGLTRRGAAALAQPRVGEAGALGAQLAWRLGAQPAEVAVHGLGGKGRGETHVAAWE